MNEITYQNVYSVCRTCLQELGEKSSLLGEKYSLHESEDLEKLLISCTEMSLEDDIELPEFICYACHEKLRAFSDFCCKSTESLCILTNVLKDCSSNKTAEEDSLLQRGHGNEEHQNVDDQIDEMAMNCGITVPTRRREKLKHCIENTVVKMQQDPIDSSKSAERVYKTDLFEEIGAEAEIDIGDIAVNSKSVSIIVPDSSDDIKTEYLEIPRNIPDMQHDADRLSTSSLNNSVQTPCLRYKDNDSDCDKLSHEYSDTSTRLSTIEKTKNCGFSRRNICTHQDIKKSTKNKNLIRKPAFKQSQISISGVSKFQCDQCPRRCVTWENYEAHLRTHQGLRPYLCNECGRSFNRAVHCRAHVREVHAPVTLQFICSFEGCGKVFKREGSYKMHYRLKHSPTYVHREPKKYICEDCGSTFKNISTFKEHRYKHVPVDEYPFKCDECNKRFTSKRSYKEHQLRHSGVKNFVCPHCGMRKTTQNELRTHINYHTKEKQWPCSKCPSIFNSSANLGMHDRIVHKGIRRFACKYCDQSFGKQDTLKHHEMRHTGEKPHGCEICGKRFIQVVALRAHLKTHNKEIARKSIKLPLTEARVTLVETIADNEAESVDPKVDLSVDLFDSSS